MTSAVPMEPSAVPTEPSIASTSEWYRPFRAWATVAILVTFSLFSIMDRQVISLMVDPIKSDLGLTDTQLGLLQGLAFALFYALAGVPLGWAVDNFSRRKVVFAGVFFWSVSAFSCGLARSFGQLFAARSCVGIGEATLGPAAVSLISDIFPREKIGRALGVYSAGFYLGSGVALAVGGWVVSLFVGQSTIVFPLIGAVAPWQAVFMVTGLPGILVAPLAFAMLDQKRKTFASASSAADGGVGFGSFVRSRGALIALIIAGFAGMTFVVYSSSAWTPTYFIRVYGWRAEEIGWVYGLLLAVSGTFGALLGGVLIDAIYRAGYRDATLRVASYASLFAWPPFVAAYLVPTATLSLVLIGIALSTLSFAGGSSYAIWQKVAPPHFRGRLTAIYIMCASLIGAGFGPVVVGAITDNAFGNDEDVGLSIAVTVGTALPLIFAVFWAGCARLRNLPDR